VRGRVVVAGRVARVRPGRVARGKLARGAAPARGEEREERAASRETESVGPHGRKSTTGTPGTTLAHPARRDGRETTRRPGGRGRARGRRRGGERSGRRRGLDHLLEAGDGALEDVHRRTEREPHVVLEARRPPLTPLARVDVEELARDDDDLLLESRLEEAHAVVEGRREAIDAAPHVEGPVGGAIDAHAEALELREEVVALGAEG